MSVRPTDGRQVRWEQHAVERRAAILTAAIEVIEATPLGDEVDVAEPGVFGAVRPEVAR